MKTIYHQLTKMLEAGESIQTGSLLSTAGSVPQTAGAFALFSKERVLAGTLGGGLLEAEAQKQAVISSVDKLNKLQWLHFNAEMGDKVGAICGGSALFLIDSNPIKHIDVYKELISSIESHCSGVLLTCFKGIKGVNPEIEKYWIVPNGNIPEKFVAVLENSQIDISQILSSRKTLFVESVTGENNEQFALFAEPIHPISRLIIVGAGHIGQALCQISSLVDFEIVIADDRPELALAERFPEASRIICKSYSDIFTEFAITNDTYIVITTQGHRTDMEALCGCVHSNAAYIGVIGSKRKATLIKEKLISEKIVTSDEWNFIHNPIGIDIHSKTVNEIAVSILAELIKERYERHFIRKQKRVSSIVLAAGKSSRMGKQKMLLPYQGKSIIQTIVSKVEKSYSNETLVVIGSNKYEITENLRAFKVNLIENERFEEGMLSSIQAGINSLSSLTDGFLVLLGDQPMVSKALINRMISVFQKSEKGLLVPVINGKRGHPVLIDRKYKKEIYNISSSVGLRELFRNNPQDILEIESDSDEILKDIDNPYDYKRETGIEIY